jgi:hypothetical protein
VSLDPLISQVSKDWEWVSFLAQYCAGSNIGKPVCQEVRWWAIGIAALAVAMLAWWILGRLSKAYGRWNHRKMSAKVADAETMNKYRWSGHDSPDALTSSGERSAKPSGKK